LFNRFDFAATLKNWVLVLFGTTTALPNRRERPQYEPVPHPDMQTLVSGACPAVPTVHWQLLSLSLFTVILWAGTTHFCT